MTTAEQDFIVVGAGFAGSVVAQQLAQAGYRVNIIDRREHVAGNAYDELDAHGVLVHRYGPHIFHTNAKRIIEYLSAFTEWRFYEHRVRAVVDGKNYPMPINRTTINQLYGLSLDEEGVKQYLEGVREPVDDIKTSEDIVVNSVGRDLYYKFFRGYTRKQWGLDPSQLSSSVAARVPVRFNTDDRYFLDDYQFMPAAGYARMFENMLDHPRIKISLGVDFAQLRKHIARAHVVYTGPIDAYFDYCYGALPYRSLRFEHLHYADAAQFQEVGTVNYPNDHAFTRITEFRHLTGQKHSGTSVVREYPQDEGEPYYPIPRIDNEELFKRYSQLAQAQSGVTFVGRLAQYRYYNMDQVVGAALKAAENILGKPLELHQ
jgi:UDP-galactopyranose mutase